MTDKRSIQFWTIAESTPSEHEDLEEGVGPYLLTTLAKKQGFDVSVSQASQYGCDAGRIIEAIFSNSQGERDVVAFSVFSGGVELLARIVVGLNGRYPIIIGGPGATTEPPMILARVQNWATPATPIALVQSEAEDIFPTLLLAEPTGWSQLPDAWSTNGRGSVTQGVFGTLRNLDEKPLVDLSSSALRVRCARTMGNITAHPSQRIKAAQALQHCFVETRRGCFYKCEFCSEPQLTESGVRKTSSDRAVREVAYLFEKFGITFFNYADNIAFDSEAWWREYAEHLMQLPYAHLLQFGGYGTPKFFSKGTWLTETLPLLYRTGLSFVTVGVQSGSPRILKEIIHRPPDDPENALKVVQTGVPLGINVKTDFIVGHPTETAADLCLTREWIGRLYQAGAHVFVRRLGVVPKSGYDFRLQEGRYGLPAQAEESEAIISDILSFHGRKDSYKRVSADTGNIPNLLMIDRERKTLFPRQSLDLAVLRHHYSNLVHLPELLRERYTLLFQAVMELKTATTTDGGPSNSRP